MAKVQINGLNKVIRNVQRVFEKTLTNALMNDIGKTVVKRIQGFTRKGFSLPRVDKRTSGTTQSPKKQQRLSKGYIQFREDLKSGKIKRGDANYVKTKQGLFRPTVSNLTLTGQLIDSIKFGFSKKRKKIKAITVNVSGTRDDGLKNVDVAKDLADRSDPRLFLGLDGKGIRVIRNKVLKLLRRNIRDFNK